MTARFALRTSVTFLTIFILFFGTETGLSDTKNGMAKQILNNVFNCLLHLFKNVNTLITKQKKKVCLTFKRNIAHNTR